MTFTIPQRCTIDTVNAALLAAGHDDVTILYDAYNSHCVSVDYLCRDEHGHQYYMTEQTSYETAKQWAEAFEAGYFQLDI